MPLKRYPSFLAISAVHLNPSDIGWDYEKAKGKMVMDPNGFLIRRDLLSFKIESGICYCI